jgi:hypothetical protein
MDHPSFSVILSSDEIEGPLSPVEPVVFLPFLAHYLSGVVYGLPTDHESSDSFIQKSRDFLENSIPQLARRMLPHLTTDRHRHDYVLLSRFGKEERGMVLSGMRIHDRIRYGILRDASNHVVMRKAAPSRLRRDHPSFSAILLSDEIEGPLPPVQSVIFLSFLVHHLSGVVYGLPTDHESTDSFIQKSYDFLENSIPQLARRMLPHLITERQRRDYVLLSRFGKEERGMVLSGMMIHDGIRYGILRDASNRVVVRREAPFELRLHFPHGDVITTLHKLQLFPNMKPLHSVIEDDGFFYIHYGYYSVPSGEDERRDIPPVQLEPCSKCERFRGAIQSRKGDQFPLLLVVEALDLPPDFEEMKERKKALAACTAEGIISKK